jgi:hypothetical protein
VPVAVSSSSLFIILLFFYSRHSDYS